MDNSYIDPDVKNRINILRFVMIFGIVVLHTPAYVNIADVGSGWFDLTKAFFQSAVFRCTVPMLTCISGYLLFRSGLDRDFKKLWLKKYRTLLIPFLVCNSLLALFVYIIQAEAKLPMSYQLYPFNLGTMLDAAFGLTTSPVNYPLNFVRDLLILMILAPLLGLMLRHSPFAGLLLVVLVFWFNMDGFLIVRNEMPIMFYIGGIAAVQNWNIKRLDKHAGLCAVVFFALCISVIYFKATNTTYIRFVAPILLWPASALLSGTRAGYWLARKSKYSFFIFLLHAPLLMVSFVLYKQLAPHLPYPLYWFLTPVAVTCFLITAYKFGMAYTSVSFTRVFGGRTA